MRLSTHLFNREILFGNMHAPSRDIAQGFGVIEQLRFICAGSSFTLNGKEKYDCIYRLFHITTLSVYHCSLIGQERIL